MTGEDAGKALADMSDAEIPTEGFSTWLESTRLAQKGNVGADVPCGNCNACCTSGYFIHIGPEETATLARIPKQLVFRAPGLPKGHVLMGYDESGRCPMFKADKCSIYEHRPQTCRNYDCRVFPATGLSVDEGKTGIARQIVRWKFAFPGAGDTREYAAVRAAAAFLGEFRREFPPGFVPENPTQQAIMAIKVYPVFLAEGDGREAGRRKETVGAVVAAYERFEEERGIKKAGLRGSAAGPGKGRQGSKPA